MRCCSACSHDGRFVVWIVFGKAFWLRECFGFRENIQTVGMCLSFGSVHPPEESWKAVKKVKSLDARKVGHPETIGSGSLCLSFVSTGVGKGKGRHMCKSTDTSGDPWEDRRTSLWFICTPVFTLSYW